MHNGNATLCLDVAIDHRIRRLFRLVAPLPDPAQNASYNGTHPSALEVFGRSRGASDAEIAVTTELAGPASSPGGIAVVLQQPRGNHRFHLGTAAVIRE